jgi:hypothetical protein
MARRAMVAAKMVATARVVARTEVKKQGDRGSRPLYVLTKN